MSTHTRQTKELEIGGHKVVVNEYLTGGEFRIVQSLLMEGMTTGDMAGGSATNNMPANSLFKAQDKVLELLVFSFDGEVEGAYQKVLDLPAEQSAPLFEQALDHLSGLGKKKADLPQ